MNGLLEARSISVLAGDARLLRDVSLEARAGEVLALVGPNGAGKSTLMRVLAGELTPDDGEVRLAGRHLDEYGARDLARMRAVLPQQTLLQFSFTALDVVLMGRNPHLESGWPGAADHAIAERCLARTETLSFATRPYPGLSGGEASRVTLARVLAQETPLLLLDEPTASLDVRHQELTMQTARSLVRDGCCVVVIVHDLNLAAAYADRIALLSKGELVACGAPQDVLRSETLSAVFECPLNVIEGLEGLDHPIVMPARGRQEG